MPYGLAYPIIVVVRGWMGVGQNRKTSEEHDEDCVEEGLKLARVKFDRDGEGDKF